MSGVLNKATLATPGLLVTGLNSIFLILCGYMQLHLVARVRLGEGIAVHICLAVMDRKNWNMVLLLGWYQMSVTYR